MKKRIFVCVAVFIILISGCRSKPPILKGKNLSVIFFDVGQGDSAMIITPGNKKILIDCGEHKDTALYLQAMNITEIDVLIITHPDADHAGGCDDVKEVAAIKKTITNTDAERDSMLEIADYALLEIIVAYDSHGRFKGDNDNSVLLKAEYGKVSFLFTGDCEWRCEKELVKTENIDVDILKVGHHGSKYSSTSEFLKKVSPSAAVISAGRKNRYSHPANETLERLKQINARIYRTDTNGTIIITTDGSSYAVI